MRGDKEWMKEESKTKDIYDDEGEWMVATRGDGKDEGIYDGVLKWSWITHKYFQNSKPRRNPFQRSAHVIWEV